MQKEYSETTKILAVLILIHATAIFAFVTLGALVANVWAKPDPEDWVIIVSFAGATLAAIIGLISWFDNRKQIYLTVAMLVSAAFAITAQATAVMFVGGQISALIAVPTSLMVLVGVIDITVINVLKRRQKRAETMEHINVADGM